MKSIDFLNHIITHKALPTSHPVILLQSKKSPIVFFSKLYNYLVEHGYTEIIDSQETDIASLLLKLQTSFLGQSMTYWIRGLPELSSKNRQQWLSYYEQYRGPHRIVSYMHDDDRVSESLIITCDEIVDEKLLKALLILNASSCETRLIKLLTQKLSHRKTPTHIDELCMLLDYLRVVGNAGEEFLKEWFDAIVTPDYSFFSLSQYFFSKSAAQFFQQWSEKSAVYPEQFWITFWSEQIWRAVHFIQYQQEKDFAQAKNIGFRLPFSFLQTDWKNYSQMELINAHNYLYSMDYQLKNGATTTCFDLFYSKFFTGQFR